VKTSSFLTMSCDFKCGDPISCSLCEPLLGTPYIGFPGGMRYSIVPGKGLNTSLLVVGKYQSVPLYKAWVLSDDSLNFHIQRISSGGKYRLSGHLNDDRAEISTFMGSLESDQGSDSLLDILLPVHIMRARRPVSLVVIAFCYFLSVEYLYWWRVPPLLHPPARSFGTGSYTRLSSTGVRA
jgi:hypothetical protein